MLVREYHQHQLIFYKDFFELVDKWLQKKKVFVESLQKGIEYRAIDQEGYRYLLKIKNANLNFSNLPTQVVQLPSNQ